MSAACCRRSAGRGLTLVEVIAGLALLATLLASILVAFGSQAAQIRAARDRYDVPMGAYQVSGEYSMLQAAFAKGWLEPQRAMLESLIGIRRAGADFIVTYFAKDAGRVL